MISVKQSDTKPIEFTLRFGPGKGKPVALDSAVVAWHMKPRPGTELEPPANLTTSISSVAGLVAGTYFYRVSAVGPQGESLASAEVVRPLPYGGAVGLSWNPVVGASSYRVYRSASSGAQIGYFATSLLTFTDSGGSLTAGLPRITDTKVLSAEVVNGPKGICRIDPDETFFTPPGLWRVEFVVIFPDTTVQTFPSDDYIDLRIVADL